MKYAIALATETDSWKWVKRAEALGFHAAWFYDTQLLNPDIFACMAIAAHETESIRLGTGVVVPSNRIEPVTANALATLNKLAPGRIDFGVGTGFTARRTMGLNALTLKETGQYIQRVRQLLAGEIAECVFDGESKKVGFLNPDLGLINLDDEVPIWFSAFGPKARQLTADLDAGWLYFGAREGADALAGMQQTWEASGKPLASLQSNLFFIGAVLNGNTAEDEARLMAQAGPSTAVIFHNFADEMGAMGGQELPAGPLKDLLNQYLEVHAGYEPADARYLKNHRGHLMFVRPEETHITPDLVRATTLSGTRDELVDQLRAFEAAGYSQVTVQLMHGHESAIDDWADVFSAV